MKRSKPASWVPTAIALLLAVAAAPAGGQESDRVQSICADCHVEAGADKAAALAHADSLSCLTCHHLGYTNDPEVSRSRRDDACVTCHREDAGAHSVHAAVPTETDASRTPECAACHSIHEDSTGMDPGHVISSRCGTCHTDSHVLHESAAVADAPTCSACHIEHAMGWDLLDAMNGCAECHEAPHPSHVQTEDVAIDCSPCHAVNDAVPIQEDENRLITACLECHEDMRPSHAHVTEDPPSCVSCHAFGVDAQLPEASVGISERCGVCHETEMAAFMSGGHAAALESMDFDLPTCASCHSAHQEVDGQRADLRIAATAECVECHSQASLIDKFGLPADATSSYLDDYHGATMHFLTAEPSSSEAPLVMICADCHGPHEVAWAEGTQVADVCVQCHEDADPKLAGAWIGHAQVGPANQMVVWAVRIFYYVMIPFVLIGLLLNIVFNLVDQRRGGARMRQAHGTRRLIARLRGQAGPPEPMVTRFSVVERLEHLGALITFPLLVVTGLPQTMPQADVGQWVISLFGGIASTRIIHRVAGFLFVALLIAHIARGIYQMVRKRGLPDMSPIRRDFSDVVAMARHMVANTPRPKVGRFDASEKFEYWGLFFGGLIMSATGLVLVFPELVAEALPGVVIAAMRTIHGLEATFAVLVVVLWHSYGVIFRPEIFPLDTTIFTGKISVERLREEHALEYEKLFPEGAISSGED